MMKYRHARTAHVHIMQKKIRLANTRFDRVTFGLWAQRASADLKEKFKVKEMSRQFAFVCVSPVGFSCINIKDTFQALNIFFS